MKGIILLDEEVKRALAAINYRATQPQPVQQQPVQPQAEPVDGAPHSVVRQSPRTDFTTRPPAPPTDRAPFPVGNSTAHLEQRSSGTTLTEEEFSEDGQDAILEGECFESFPPILREDDSRSSTASAAIIGGGEYAGTSSGLKLSVSWMLGGVVGGILLAAMISNQDLSTETVKWINLPGELFLRALQCIIVPYVFCSVAVAVGDIVFVGKVSVIGWQTAKILVTFWIATVAMGVTVALMCRAVFRIGPGPNIPLVFTKSLKCANGGFAIMTPDLHLACAETRVNASTFDIVNSTTIATSHHVDVETLTLTGQLMHMIQPIVSSNIISSFERNELLSIITFAMVLGSIAGRSYFTKTRRVNYLYLLLVQLRNTFFLLMDWTIWLTPVASVSMIAGSSASNIEFAKMFNHMYPYLLVSLLAGTLQSLVVYPFITFLKTGCQPYRHMRDMVRAYIFAFSCASSLATMPVTLSCVQTARMCSQSIANFVISIGVVSSVSGMGFYVPIGVVFLAEASGNGEQLTPLRIFGLCVLSLLACAGTPPIPSAGVAVIATAYTTLFGEMPVALPCVVAMDFFFDRVVTACNVNDDIMALKIIAETTDETVVQDRLGERF